MNLLDWCWSSLVLAYAVSGYWQGFVTGAFATAGLLLGGLLGVWLAPDRARRRRPRRCWSRWARCSSCILCASLGQALLQFVGAPDPRPDHLAAGPRPRRRRRRRAQRGRRAARRLGARRRALAARGIRGITPHGARLQGARRGQPGAARRAPARLLRRSTTSSARPSSRATSSRSRPSGSSTSPPGPPADAPRPRRRPRRASVRQDPQHQRLRPGHRGLRLPLRPRPA